MGVTIRQKEKGRDAPWWFFVHHNGKRRSKMVGTKKAAKALQAELEQRIAAEEFNIETSKPAPTFRTYSEKWLSLYVERECRESTWTEYKGILDNHLWPVFADVPIDRIGRGEIRDFLLLKAEGFSKKRVMLIKDVLSGVFNWALDSEVITANPTAGITKRLWPKSKRAKATVEQKDVFTESELETFLQTAKTERPEHYPFFLAAARTGMRLGELLALRWQDVDFKESTITIRRSYRRGIFTRPKNGKSRTIDMSGELAEVLRPLSPYRPVCKPEELKALVFNKYGRPYEQNEIRRIYKPILKAAKLRYVKFHGLRHTVASILLSKGAPIYYVSQQLGHSSIDITTDVYGHWLRSEDNRHINLLDSQPHPHRTPAPKEKPQPVEIAANNS